MEKYFPLAAPLEAPEIWWGLDWHYDYEGTLTNVASDFGEYSTRLFAEHASELIGNYDFNSKPLFLYLPLQSVHNANTGYEFIQAPDETEFKFWVGA